MIAFATETPKHGYETPDTTKRHRVRRELVEAFADAQAEKATRRRLSATYDAAQDGDEFKNIWANADAHDADSANSPAVRHKLIQRSRYEVANNGYAAGIAGTYANDLVGVGPTLRMQTGSEGFNRLVEAEFGRWAKAVGLRRKLWTMAHAKGVDGETFAVLRRNPGLPHAVKLDVCLYEAEQFQTPYLPYGTEGRIDGIRFDAFGNPSAYDLLKHHPGSSNFVNVDLETETIPARFVLHWFRMTRPGQHRQVPESASTLNIGAAARRWREAVIAAAENIADFSLFIRTMFEPDEMDSVQPMSTLDIQKRMMTALPSGYDAFQPKAEQPTANHEDFNKSLINEQARPKQMPYNKAACDSSDYNFASGRLDHSTYYGSLDVDRADCDDMVLDQAFDVWFDEAVMRYGWLGGNPEALNPAARAHAWDWPTHQVADEKSHAQATQTKLATGQANIAEVYSECGKDFADSLAAESAATGVAVDDLQKLYVMRNLPQHVLPYAAEMLGVKVATAATSSAPAETGDEDGGDDDET